MAGETTAKRPRGRPRSTSTDEGSGTVQALDRGLALLKALSREGRSALSDLSLRAGMPPSSAYRLLVTMQKHGFAEFDDGRQEWSVGVEAYRVGSTFLSRTGLMEAGRQVMRELMEETGETANLAIMDDGDVVFIGQVETHQPIRAFFRPGTRSAMHVSGIGKALLAHLPRGTVEQILQKKGLEDFTERTLSSPDALFAHLEETRERGWSIDDEERYEGMRCVAAPIFNAFGEAIAGVSVSGPTVRLPKRTIAEIGPKVRHAAESITRSLGGNSS